ncbi:metalloregulator ArsR/SmtB family transcription factor [Candidatus Parcubacteria bacterium]|nr:metalloregulator ArsR/SmtB family transcription factor [Candidatus Parcubacteria bacterium]
MVKYEEVTLDRVFYALSDEVRRKIVDHLYRGDRTVAELSAPFKISAPAISRHISILKRTGLITVRRQGRNMVCSLELGSLMKLGTWLARYEKLWGKQLEAIRQEITSNAGKMSNKA